MAILDRYAGFILDLDGSSWGSDGISRDGATFLRKAERSGRPVVFVTNDSSRTPHQIVRELADARITVEPTNVLTSAMAAASLLAASGHPATLSVGGAALAAALTEAQVPLVEDPDTAEAVVVGWDAELTLADLQRAAVAIEAGARFIGAAPDRVLHRSGMRWPGPGALLALLREATGAAPEVVGKPNRLLFELATERMDVEGALLVVGHGVATDLAAADRLGLDMALILDGPAGYVELIDAPHPPAWVIAGLGALATDEPAVVRPAEPVDLSAIRELLAEAGFEEEGAAARLETTLVAEGPDGTLVGTIAWELVASAAHLRGVTITPKERGHGTGSLLVARALMELRQTDCEWVYLLTPGAEQLFEQLGFYRVQRDRVPEEVLATAQFGGAAEAATALVRRLR